jgi:peptidoglycan/xylan/chitin deacetylase (PgdA/CDA1 family)
MDIKRDYVGYGQTPPKFKWPNGCKLALSLVFNYEEGSEHSFATDGIVESIGEFGPVDVSIRDVGMESVYEYGQRVGIWRILRLLEKYGVKATFYATARALEVNKEAARTIVKNGHEICDHGFSWTELFRMTEREERDEIRRSINLIEKITGKKPVGFYAREPSPNTVKLLKEFKNFIYDSDSYADDIPYYDRRTKMLIVPYTPDSNDFHFQNPMNRFSTSSEFFSYLKDSFDTLYYESGKASKMMSAAFHVRVTGRPGRLPALDEFLEYVTSKSDVWIATREEIARFWLSKFRPDRH